MKNFSFIMMAIAIIFGYSSVAANPNPPKQVQNRSVATDDVLDASWFSSIRNHAALSKIEAGGRNSSVRVERPDGRGYGSGTYGYYKGHLVVFTAQHVVKDNSFMNIHGRAGEVVPGFVVYTDEVNDFAVLVLDKMHTRDPMKIKPVNDELKNFVGWNITYTGFPSGYDLLTITGRIAGVRVDGSAVVAHSFTWMGASGSGVFNSKGEYVGPLVAVGLGKFQVTQVVEDMVWIIPATILNWNEIDEVLSNF